MKLWKYKGKKLFKNLKIKEKRRWIVWKKIAKKFKKKNYL